jgi:hypothetical protein
MQQLLEPLPLAAVRCDVGVDVHAGDNSRQPSADTLRQICR